MDLAFLLFQKTIVMLIYLVIGCICYKTKLVTDAGNKSMTNIAIYVLTPAMILMSFRQEFSKKLFDGLLVTMGLSCIGFAIIIPLVYLLVRKKTLGGKDNPDCVVERFSSLYSNCGFMGIPLANELFGAEGVFYITAFHSVFTLLIWTHGVYLITGDKKNISIKKVITNPSVIATFLGIILFAVDYKPPVIVNSALSAMTTAVAPLAMIVAGVMIAQSDFKSIFTNKRIYWVALIRLVLFPVLLTIVLTGIFKLSGVSETVLLATLLGFSCPTATTGTMFAIRFDKNAKTAAQIFAFTTILSVITMPLIIYFQSLL